MNRTWTMRVVGAVATAVAVALVVGLAGPAGADEKFLRIGTASLGGNYFPMGAAIGAVIEQKISGHKATPQATGGSAFNMTALEKQELELGICQGPAVEAGIVSKKTPHVRTIANFNASPQHVLVRANLNITSVADLKGKKLEMLAAGDGVEVASKAIMDALGIPWSDIKAEYSGNRVQAASRLKTGQVDAIIDGTGIGGAWVSDLVGDGKFKLISLSDREIQQVSAKYPAFSAMTIPANSYKGQAQSVKTVGNWTVLVTRADLSTDLVYNITKVLFENQSYLKDRHKYFTDLKPENIVDAVIAPLHPGTEKYYKETGILK